MKIPDSAIIPDAKIIKYLLVYREQDDKSKFLAQGGFTQDNSEQLKLAIRYLTDNNRAIEDMTNEYGTFYRVEGELISIAKQNLSVITIWLHRKIDNQFQFITLKPKKEKKINA
jgi:hypothetical protein